MHVNSLRLNNQKLNPYPVSAPCWSLWSGWEFREGGKTAASRTLLRKTGGTKCLNLGKVEGFLEDVAFEQSSDGQA